MSASIVFAFAMAKDRTVHSIEVPFAHILVHHVVLINKPSTITPTMCS